MTDWARVCADGFDVPSDRPLAELVAELSAMLRSPDPALRDRQAYSTSRGVRDASLLVWLRDRGGDVGVPVSAGTVGPLER